MRWCSTTLAEQPLLAGIKHLNRLEQVLARREWTDPGIAEGLMCDGRGRVVSGTRTNVFFVRGNVLVTPRVHRCGVAGTLRTAVMAAADQLGLQAIESDVWKEDIDEAEEVFLTNTLIGVWPVKMIGDSTLTAGPVTRRVVSELNG